MTNEYIDWTTTLLRLGVDESFLNGRNGPCPFCGGKDRFRYTNFEDKGSYYCSGCGPGNGFQFVINHLGCDFEEALSKVREFQLVTHKPSGLSQDKKYQRNKNKLIEYYRSLVPGRGTPAEVYLASRGIPFPDPFYIRLNPEVWANKREVIGCFWLPMHDDGYGAMVWKAVDGVSRRITQLHFTFLTENGTKAPLERDKKYSSSIEKLNPDSFRVAPLTKGCPNTCILAEGIETALSAREIMRRLAPSEEPPTTFASMDSGMMEKFVPSQAYAGATWWICGDRDESNTGQRSASICKANIGKVAGGYDKVHIVLPDEEGQDWNDILLSGDESRMMNICRPI